MTQTSGSLKPGVSSGKQPGTTTIKLGQPTGIIPWARRGFPFIKDEVQHLADRFWNLAEDELFSGDIKPRADLVETESSLIIVMDVPGFEPDQIDIQVNENTITIRSQRESAGCGENDEDHFYHRHERPCGSFSRTFALPREISNQASAEYRNGVLTVTLTKSKNSKSRKIKVSV